MSVGPSAVPASEAMTLGRPARLLQVRPPIQVPRAWRRRPRKFPPHGPEAIRIERVLGGRLAGHDQRRANASQRCSVISAMTRASRSGCTVATSSPCTIPMSFLHTRSVWIRKGRANAPERRRGLPSHPKVAGFRDIGGSARGREKGNKLPWILCLPNDQSDWHLLISERLYRRGRTRLDLLLPAAGHRNCSSDIAHLMPFLTPRQAR